jgi:hypothetical protein
MQRDSADEAVDRALPYFLCMKRLLWIAISVIGAVAIGVIVLRRGETINALWLVTAAACTYALGYRFYSAFIAAKVLALSTGFAGLCFRGGVRGAGRIYPRSLGPVPTFSGWAARAEWASASSARTFSGRVNIASRPSSCRGHSSSGRSR